MKIDIYNPERRYNIIYADPPWTYQDKGRSGNAAQHYALMRDSDICGLPISNITAENSVLFLWATYPKLREAFEVIEAWGFTYKTIAFQWIKQNKSGKGFFFGLGRWTRGNTEPVLLAVKGKPKRISAGVGQLIISPLREHSQKPDETRDKIVQLCGDLPRVELFARSHAPGWDFGGWKLRITNEKLLSNGGKVK